MQVCICTILWTSHTGVSLAISHFFSHFVVCVARTKSWPSWTKAVLWCEFPSVFIDSFDRNLKHTPIHVVDKLWNHGNLDTDGGTLQKHLKTSLVQKKTWWNPGNCPRIICDLLRLILRNCGLHSDSKSNDPYWSLLIRIVFAWREMLTFCLQS